jgi:hypothetical protein
VGPSTQPSQRYTIRDVIRGGWQRTEVNSPPIDMLHANENAQRLKSRRDAYLEGKVL